SALAALCRVDELWEEIRPALDAILEAAPSLAGAQGAAAAITAGSDRLLADSESLFQAFTAFGSMADSSLPGNVWISILFGALALAAIVGLVYSLNRAQRERFETTIK